MQLIQDPAIKQQMLDCARGIADWLCSSQVHHSDSDANAGRIYFQMQSREHRWMANNWNMAFAAMGLLAAARAFKTPRYETSAHRIHRYQRTLQIFDPELPRHHGAIREMTPQTPWCYTRDALSAAWGFVEMYRHTGQQTDLDRAVLWARWFEREGRDAQGYPLWGVQFEPYFHDQTPQMCNDVQGSFQGGSLNFFYHLAQATGDAHWTGELFTTIADQFVSRHQQPDGSFASIDSRTGKPRDPQGGLHGVNDDLGTLGLLCAWKVTGETRYLQAIDRFVRAAFAHQGEDGHFEASVAGIPVLLNIIHEAGDALDLSWLKPEAVDKALRALMGQQHDGDPDPALRGGMVEWPAKPEFVCARSSCYSLIVLLKLAANEDRFLTACVR